MKIVGIFRSNKIFSFARNINWTRSPCDNSTHAWRFACSHHQHDSSCKYPVNEKYRPRNQLFIQTERTISLSSLRASSGTKDSDISWDDSGWMNQDDENAEAYKDLDVTKLKPFPEFRNVAAGPVWGPNAFENTWRKYFEERAPDIIAKNQDKEWESYIEENQFSPLEYFTTPDFEERYQERLIWQDYRRNHKGGTPPQRTRTSCFKNGKISTGSPCPICRDSKILINYKNIKLLQHFIDPLSGVVHRNLRTGVCRKKQGLLERAIWLSRDFGLLIRPVEVFTQDMDSYRVDHPAVRPKR